MIIAASRNAEPIGIVEALQARRAQILNTQSDAVRRRILGLPPLPVMEDKPQAAKAPPWKPKPEVKVADKDIIPWPYLPPTPAEVARSQRQRIVDIVCEVYGIREACLFSETRVYKVSHPRQGLMWLARYTLGMSAPQIGKWLDNRDHTTVLHGTAAHEFRMKHARLARDKAYAKKFEAVLAMVTNQQPTVSGISAPATDAIR